MELATGKNWIWSRLEPKKKKQGGRGSQRLHEVRDKRKKSEQHTFRSKCQSIRMIQKAFFFSCRTPTSYKVTRTVEHANSGFFFVQDVVSFKFINCNVTGPRESSRQVTSCAKLEFEGVGFFNGWSVWSTCEK